VEVQCFPASAWSPPSDVDSYPHKPLPSPVKRGRSSVGMGRIPLISRPPNPKGLWSRSVWVLGCGDCSRRLEGSSRIWHDRVHRVGIGGRGSWNLSITGQEIGPALSHHRSTIQGQPFCRYSVLGLRCFVLRVQRVRQPIVTVRQPFVPVQQPSSGVGVSVRLSTGGDRRAGFPASPGWKSRLLDDHY